MVHLFLSVPLLVKIALKQGVFAYDCIPDGLERMWKCGDFGRLAVECGDVELIFNVLS